MNKAANHPRVDVLRLTGRVQHYDWGGHDFIPRLLGVPNRELRPFAELWIGAHPQAPAMAGIAGAGTAGASRPLDEVIAEAPQAYLGPAACARFGERLPYLLKMLEVRKMLSIQAHPNRTQAREGFARENAANIDIAATHRNYKDLNHKPEVGVALTDFWMLHGFRPLDKIAETLANVPEFSPLMPDFSQRLLHAGNDPQARRCLLRDLYAGTMTMPQPQVDEILRPLLARIGAESPWDRDRPEHWVLEAARDLPFVGCDRGIFSIYLLNLLHLSPGQGTFQPAGLPHAYLEGVTVELMANSDNVLRGGLTRKHVDVPELLKILSFESHAPEVFEGVLKGDAERVYRTPAEEFELSRIDLGPGRQYRGEAANGPHALLMLHGSATFVARDLTLPLEPGASLLVPFGIHYRLAADARPVTAYKAALPAIASPDNENSAIVE